MSSSTRVREDRKQTAWGGGGRMLGWHSRRTRFLSADGELLAGCTAADLVVGVHPDAVDAGGMQLHNVCLVVGRGDVPGGVHVVPRVWTCKHTHCVQTHTHDHKQSDMATNRHTHTKAHTTINRHTNKTR